MCSAPGALLPLPLVDSLALTDGTGNLPGSFPAVIVLYESTTEVRGKSTSVHGILHLLPRYLDSSSPSRQQCFQLSHLLSDKLSFRWVNHIRRSISPTCTKGKSTVRKGRVSKKKGFILSLSRSCLCCLRRPRARHGHDPPFFWLAFGAQCDSREAGLSTGGGGEEAVASTNECNEKQCVRVIV